MWHLRAQRHPQALTATTWCRSRSTSASQDAWSRSTCTTPPTHRFSRPSRRPSHAGSPSAQTMSCSRAWSVPRSRTATPHSRAPSVPHSAVHPSLQPTLSLPSWVRPPHASPSAPSSSLTTTPTPWSPHTTLVMSPKVTRNIKKKVWKWGWTRRKRKSKFQRM